MLLRRKRKRSRRWLRLRMALFLSLAGLLTLLAIFAPLLAPNDPNATSSAAMNQPPCAQYPFGTDRYGRCVCSRVLIGARTSIFSSLALVGLTFLFGSVLGMIAGYYGGIADTLVMRLADVLLSFPQMVLAIAVAGILGGGMGNAMLAMEAITARDLPVIQGFVLLTSAIYVVVNLLTDLAYHLVDPRVREV